MKKKTSFLPVQLVRGVRCCFSATGTRGEVCLKFRLWTANSQSEALFRVSGWNIRELFTSRGPEGAGDWLIKVLLPSGNFYEKNKCNDNFKRTHRRTQVVFNVFIIINYLIFDLFTPLTMPMSVTFKTSWIYIHSVFTWRKERRSKARALFSLLLQPVFESSVDSSQLLLCWLDVFGLQHQSRQTGGSILERREGGKGGRRKEEEELVRFNHTMLRASQHC